METFNKRTFIKLITLLIVVACSKSEQKQERVQRNNTIFEGSLPIAQVFDISNMQDTIIIGKNGTEIHIPKNAFDTKGKDNIQLTLIEYYEMSDILLEGLTTMSDDGKLLISGGYYT